MNGFNDLTADSSGLPKRTSELRQAESTSSHFSPSLITSSESTAAPPRLATLQEHSAFSNKNRPRAGTLPSTFHLTPSSISSSSTSTSNLNPLAVDNLLAPTPLHNGAASLPGSGSNTPLDLSYPSALLPKSAVAPSSRLRSGSLTALPPTSGNLSSAFGPGTNVFSSGDWTPRPVQVVGSATRKALEDTRSPDGSAYGDEHVRTLDYLGLDDEASTGLNVVGGGGGGSGGGGGVFGSVGEGLSSEGGFDTMGSIGAPSMHRLGSTGSMKNPLQPSSDLNQQQSRLRSNTVAAFPRTSPNNASDSYLRPFSHHPSSSISASSYPNLVNLASNSISRSPLDDENSSSYHRSNSSTDSGRLLYATTLTPEQHSQQDTSPPSTSTSSHPSSHHPLVTLRTNDSTLSLQRARAATLGGPGGVGILEDNNNVSLLRRRAGTTIGGGQGQGGFASNPSTSTGVDLSSSTTDYTPLRGHLASLSISEDHQTSNSYSRPRTPEQILSMSPPHQQPTRSLWVGNLDPNTTPAELQQVFAPYGAIESLRLIPDKECGFVNFVSVADAIRAKEDVLNRLGGQLTKTSGLVRIGYGKAEATPAPAAPGLVHPRSTASGAAVLTGADLNLQTQPTRALWVGSIPSSTTPNHLLAIFSSFGQIESARVLTHKSCGFVNFERLDDAVAARKSLNGREILGAEVGPVRIGYAKVPSKVVPSDSTDLANGLGGGGGGGGGGGSLYGAISQLDGVTGIPIERQLQEGQLQDYRSNLVIGLVSNGHYASSQAINNNTSNSNSAATSSSNLFAPGAILPPAPGEPQVETLSASINEQQLVMRELSQGDPDLEEHVQAVAISRPPMTYYNSIPLNVMNDPRWARRYTVQDAPRLREIRKKLDAESPQDEVDTLAYELLDEVIPLASDYIGNTIVQKLFEQCSRTARLTMLERIAPHLAPIGTHKNGTWAVQKIIQCAEAKDEYAIIEQNLQPYVPPLLLNDFGNYVVQGTLRFGSPYSDFLFNGVVDRIWEIGSGRFGARSTRQTLENPDTPRLQIKRVAVSIVLNAIPLATSSNGALLLTWFLEASELPSRYSLVAPRFSPHLSHLFTHKLASQSVMRVINQTVDPEAQRMILDALFDSEGKVLEDILGDQMHGTASISKVVGSTFLSEHRRQEMNERIKTAIETLNVQSVPAYRKLMEEIGLAYSGPAYPAQATPSAPLNGSSPVYEQRSSANYQVRRGSSPRDQRSTGLAVPSTPHRQPWNTNPQNSAQYSQMPPPPPPPFLNYSPQYNQMQYPPTTSFSQFPYGPSSSPVYPSYNNVSTRENGGGNRENGNVGGLSPILTHAPPPPLGSGGGGPFSPPNSYPFSPGGDPYSALRINNHVGFNPQFSPMSSPLPFYGQSFSQQQQNGASH